MQGDPTLAAQLQPFRGVDIGASLHRAETLRDIAQQRRLRQMQMAKAGMDLSETSEDIKRKRQLLERVALRDAILQKAYEGVNPDNLDNEDAEEEFYKAGQKASMMLFKGGFPEDSEKIRTNASQVYTEALKRKKAIHEDEVEKKKKLRSEIQSNLKTENQASFGTIWPQLIKYNLVEPEGRMPFFKDKKEVLETIAADDGPLDRLITDEKQRAERLEAKAKERKTTAEANIEEGKLAESKMGLKEWTEKLFPGKHFDQLRQFEQAAVRKQMAPHGDFAEPKEPKKEKWESEQELAFSAYSAKALNNKPTDRMTAPEKVAAQNWYEGLKPHEKTDWERRVELAKEDPEFFQFVTRGEKKVDKAAVLMRVIGLVMNPRIEEEDRKDEYERWRTMYGSLEEPVELPTWVDVKKTNKEVDVKKTPSLLDKIKSGLPFSKGAPAVSAPAAPPASVPASTAPAQPTPPKPIGLVTPGNINLNSQPEVTNADGSVSTVRSMSFEDNGREVLVPTVAHDGSRILSDDEAIAQYRKSGKHLGIFDTPAHATRYAQQLHTDYATGKIKIRKTTNKAAIVALIKNSQMTYEEAKKLIEDAGGRVIE